MARRFWRRVDFWTDAVLCLALIYLACHALFQQFRGVPVEPSWSWGIWAFGSAARLTLQDIRRKL